MKIVGFKLENVGKVWLLDTVRGSSVVPILIIESLLGNVEIQIYPEFRFGYKSLCVTSGMISFHIPVKGCGVEKSLSTGILKILYNTDRESNAETLLILKEFSSLAEKWYDSAKGKDEEGIGL